MPEGKKVKTIFECFMEDVQDLNQGSIYSQTKPQLIKNMNIALHKGELNKKQCEQIVKAITV